MRIDHLWCLGPAGIYASIVTDPTIRNGSRCILDLIAQGHSNKEIARKLGIAPETVKSHLRRIFIKLDVDRRAMAVLRARRLGILRRS
jgi:DNA-binding CsgD family transcriptional regulator